MNTKLDEGYDMDDQLVGYLLGALEIDESCEVERRLGECEETRRKLEVFRSSLLLLEVVEHAEPPGGLASCTCELIRRRREQNPA
jgi:hypothetical protein